MVGKGTSLFLVVGFFSCGDARSGDPVILALGSENVRRSEFDRHVKALEARGGAPLSPSVRKALIEPFLEERVLVLEARNRGFLKPGSSPEEEEAAVRGLLVGSVHSKVRVTDEEVAGYYQEHAAEFRVPETMTLRQILVPTQNEARDVRRRLQRDPKSFEVLARTRSRGPEASSGGLMGTFSRGQLPPELETAAFALAPGATSDIVTTPLGYHVLRVESRQPAREPTLEGCKAEIRALLSRQRSDESERQFVRSLLARAKVNHEAAQAPPRDQ